LFVIYARGGIIMPWGELMGDNLIEPAVVSLSMESWRRTEQWIKVRCEYPK
jgi:hypothetical protein